MPDMLVKLYTLPPLAPALSRCQEEGIFIKRALMPEMEKICAFAAEKFSTPWAAECRGCFANRPVSLFVAYKKGEILGFACYDTTCRNFFGPTGVDESLRGKGAGTALLLACLHDMLSQGYAYAIIGGAGPAEYYKKVCGAIEIADSSPGIYKDLLC